MEKQTIQWFPGHMAKTRRLIQESLRLCDAAVEIVDARIPVSSRNPELDQLLAHKPRIILLNKADMADGEATRQWVAAFQQQGMAALPVDCRSGSGLQKFRPLVREVLREKIAQNAAKGMRGKPLRLMILGIPNVGKSSFINRMAGNRKAKVADKPGVTRSNQWFSLDKGIELLDTPGVLWPKFDDEIVGLHLAFTGAVKDEIMDMETLAANLLSALWEEAPEMLLARYAPEWTGAWEPFQFMEMVGQKRGMLRQKNEIDLERVAVMLLDEFRAGKIGRITLEHMA